MEILKQKQYKPMEVADKIVIRYAGTTGYLDEVPTEFIPKYETEIISEADSLHATLLDDIKRVGDLTDELRKRLDDFVKDFTERFISSIKSQK